MKTLIIVIVSVILGNVPLPTKEQPPSTPQPKAASIVQEIPKQENKVADAVVAVVDTKAAAEAPAPTPTPAPQQSGTCADWMAAAGITDVANATTLLNWESHCNPNAINPSSGACGLAQELPCGKSGCSLGDGACQMKWFNSYVLNRYGSMAAAVQFHIVHNWY